MSKHITVLSGLLLLQLVVAGILFSADNSLDSHNKVNTLVNLDNDELNNIKIIDGDTELTLTKNSNNWQLNDYPEVKLQGNKVSSLTNELAQVKVSWPVTNTASSHERFKVATDNFEKQVVFTDNSGNKQTLVLGKSPSFKQLYARNIDQDEVFSIEFSAYQLSADADDWLDKSMLSIDSINKISHSVVNLAKNDDNWQLAPPSSLAEQQVLDNSAIEDFVNQLTSLSVNGITKQKPTATNTLTVHDERDKAYVYSFAADEDNYFVKRDDINQWFTLSKNKFEQLANLSLDKFISQPETQEEEASETLSD